MLRLLQRLAFSAGFASLDSLARAATRRAAAAVRGQKPRLQEHFFYGALQIDPGLLVAWYLFPTDADLAEARANGLTARLEQLTRHELAQVGYPADAVSRIAVQFTTHETIGREAGGNYWEYFK